MKKTKTKFVVGIISGLALLSATAYFANSNTLSGRINYNFDNYKIQKKLSVYKQQSVDLCNNMEGVQTVMPVGFITGPHNNCVVNENIAGKLIVQLDNSLMNQSVSQGQNNARFTRIKFTNTGTLPVKVTKLSLIATQGMNRIESVKLVDVETNNVVISTYPDGAGHFYADRFPETIFKVMPGVDKYIDIVGNVKSEAPVDSIIALGLYINMGADQNVPDPLDFYARAGNENDQTPWISYHEGDSHRLIFNENIRNAEGNYRIIMGPTATVRSAEENQRANQAQQNVLRLR